MHNQLATSLLFLCPVGYWQRSFQSTLQSHIMFQLHDNYLLEHLDKIAVHIYVKQLASYIYSYTLVIEYLYSIFEPSTHSNIVTLCLCRISYICSVTYQFPPSKFTQNIVSFNSFSAKICIECKQLYDYLPSQDTIIQ